MNNRNVSLELESEKSKIDYIIFLFNKSLIECQVEYIICTIKT